MCRSDAAITPFEIAAVSPAPVGADARQLLQSLPAEGGRGNAKEIPTLGFSDNDCESPADISDSNSETSTEDGGPNRREPFIAGIPIDFAEKRMRQRRAQAMQAQLRGRRAPLVPEFRTAAMIRLTEPADVRAWDAFRGSRKTLTTRRPLKLAGKDHSTGTKMSENIAWTTLGMAATQIFSC